MDDPESRRCAVELRAGAEHGFTRSGGISGAHHFCFAAYQRPDRLEWGALRTLSEFELAPGTVRPPSFYSGFDIVTLVTAGAMPRTGTYDPRQLLTTGSMELVSSGRGVQLGLEAAGGQPARFTEIWLKTGPGRREPRREWLAATPEGFDRPLATDGHSIGSLALRAAAQLYQVVAPAGRDVTLSLADRECAYCALGTGAMSANGVEAAAGDGLAITGPGRLDLIVQSAARLLFIRSATTP